MRGVVVVVFFGQQGGRSSRPPEKASLFRKQRLEDLASSSSLFWIDHRRRREQRSTQGRLKQKLHSAPLEKPPHLPQEEETIHLLDRFSRLYVRLCKDLREDSSVLLLYSMLHRNTEFLQFVAVRIDVDTLLLPLLEML